jgi:hypothetical protein
MPTREVGGVGEGRKKEEEEVGTQLVGILVSK